MARINELLQFVYGDRADEIAPKIEGLIAQFWQDRSKPTHYFDETDTVLITYGDMVQTEGEAPLQTLRKFLQKHIAGTVTGVHLLPFYPWSSDDGFSVIDYAQVDPALGDWADVKAYEDDFRLMFDAVINHMSAKSQWFEKYLANEAPYSDFFIETDPSADLSQVFRPRALPLLTQFGEKHVWTTFSADQVDLNFDSAELLLKILKILLLYAQNGAEMIRLDAIAFLWKEIGTTCLHLPQTHAIIQLIRAILDATAPQVSLVTETNVPHKDNISYFGDGRNEAQMVYNFSLPPLTLHTFHTGDATVLTKWAKTLDLPSDQTTFFNFCASHDGIGVTPARGLLSETEVSALATRVEALGGRVSYKANSDGTQSPYELNINYLDALGDPKNNEDDELRAKRFLCSQAIMLALRGVPGIYFHSLFGSRGWQEGVQQTGRNRTINREKLQLDVIESELKIGLRASVFEGLMKMIGVRSAESSFNPHAPQQILDIHPNLFAIKRGTVLCLHNVSNHPIDLELIGYDTLTQKNIHLTEIPPYATYWLKEPPTQANKEKLATTHNNLILYNAGLPRFPRNFTRDSIISAWLANDPVMLRDQLIYCAHHQGTKTDPTTGEEPGKIHHEMPGYPIRDRTTTYNACDTTAFFLLGHALYQQQNPDPTFLIYQHEPIQNAIDYITRHVTDDGLFIESPAYADADQYALKVTYWKDSVILHRPDGEPSYPATFTLAHIQNLSAIRAMASLYRNHRLTALAHSMKKALSLLWDDKRGVFYTAIDADGAISAVTSDNLHALAYLEPNDLTPAQLASIERASEQLETHIGYINMTPTDAATVSYAYHATTVWPFEQALIHMGATKFGLHRVARVAQRINRAITDSDPETLQLKVTTNPAISCDPQLWTIAAKTYFQSNA